MGIYIKGMEMPTSGTYEVSIDNSYGKDKTVMSLFVRGDDELICGGCYEIVPVLPHGDLIDRDALKNVCKENAKSGIGLWVDYMDISLAPTIIHAEGEQA